MHRTLRSALCSLALLAPAALPAQGGQPQSQPASSQPTASQPSGSQPTASQPSDVPAAARKLLDKWAESVRDIRTLRVRFTQQKKLRIMRRPRVSEGETLLKGKQVRMEVGPKGGEAELILLASPEDVRVYLPRHKKLEIYPAKKGGKQKSPFPLMVEDIEELPRDYRIVHKVVVQDEVEREVLTMTPRTKDSDFRQVRLTFRDGKLTAVGQTNKKGDTVEMEITEFTVNPEVEDADLKLDIPADAKVVRIGG